MPDNQFRKVIRACYGKCHHRKDQPQGLQERLDIF